jgi:hypothetical protein
VIEPQLTSLVSERVRTYGRFESRPQVVNPLEAFVGVEQRVRQLRLKEWIGFTLIHPELYSSLVIQDAHYLASSEIYAFDRRRSELHQHASTGRGGSLAMPLELFGSECAYTRPGYEVAYTFVTERGTHRISLDIAATQRAPALRGELTLDGAGASPPLSVSARLPRGSIYTHKRLYPASGSIRVGDSEFVFDPARDLAIIDEHKSFLPYRTRWLWGTFARIGLDGPVGANFISRAGGAAEPEESCIWTPQAAEPLGDVSFAPESAARLSPWRIWSADGRLDVVFEPDGRKDVKHQLLLAAIDYFQLFGRYSGTLHGAERTHTLRGVHGVCESMLARL